MHKKMTFAQAINDALSQAMEMDKNVICYGLGVDDPKGVFGTTLGLQEKFGNRRVFDMPVSENAMTGIAIGSALNGIRPIMIHQRLDFFLLAMDQLVNNAAKWHYMFGGRSHVPITIRLILGRGWGQGPTHSQNLQSWFAHVPGLKVVMPATTADAKGLLLSSIYDNNPVVFLEHRWLHNLEGEVPDGDYRVPIGKAQVLKEGNDVTIVSMSYMTIEALHAVEFLTSSPSLCKGGSGRVDSPSCELIDLRTIKPLDWETVFASVRKTGRLIVLDTANDFCSVGSEIVARVSSECFESLKCAPKLLALPDLPSPTSPPLSKVYYKGSMDIAAAVNDMLGYRLAKSDLSLLQRQPHDVPGDWFKGPF
jgi:pyruvate dehydrogenase E1 component beta subunit